MKHSRIERYVKSGILPRFPRGGERIMRVGSVYAVVKADGSHVEAEAVDAERVQESAAQAALDDAMEAEAIETEQVQVDDEPAEESAGFVDRIRSQFK